MAALMMLAMNRREDYSKRCAAWFHLKAAPCLPKVVQPHLLAA
jgi:hypothetical protein